LDAAGAAVFLVEEAGVLVTETDFSTAPVPPLAVADTDLDAGLAGGADLLATAALAGALTGADLATGLAGAALTAALAADFATGLATDLVAVGLD
jgi:hypothetical protein